MARQCLDGPHSSWRQNVVHSVLGVEPETSGKPDRPDGAETLLVLKHCKFDHTITPTCS